MPTQFITNPRRYPDTTSFAKRMGLPSPFFLDSHGMPYQVVRIEDNERGAVNFGPTLASLPRPDLRGAKGYRRKNVVLEDGDTYPFLVKTVAGGRAKTARKNPSTRPSAAHVATVTLRVPAAAHREWEFHEIDTYDPDDMPEKQGFVEAWHNARKAGNVYVYALSAPAFAYLASPNGPIHNTLDIARDNEDRRLVKSLEKLAQEVAAMKPRANLARSNPASSRPSVKALSQIVTRAEAVALRDLMESASVADVLRVADRMMDGFGVAYFHSRNDTMRTPDGLDFVNMGDTYDLTLVYDHGKGKYVVTSWGDIVEADMRLPKSRQRFAG